MAADPRSVPQRHAVSNQQTPRPPPNQRDATCLNAAHGGTATPEIPDVRHVDPILLCLGWLVGHVSWQSSRNHFGRPIMARFKPKWQPIYACNPSTYSQPPCRPMGNGTCRFGQPSSDSSILSHTVPVSRQYPPAPKTVQMKPQPATSHPSTVLTITCIFLAK